MTRVDVRRQAGPAGVAGRRVLRYPLSVPGLEELARRTDTALPWHARPGAAPVSDLARALGDGAGAVGAASSATEFQEGEPGTAELVRLGLLEGERLHDGVIVALGGFAHPRVHVDLDLAVRRPTGTARLRAWHRRHDAGITGLCRTGGWTGGATGGGAELAWWPDDCWPDELARTVTPSVSPPMSDHGEHDPPAAYLQLPYELLLASGAALREGRADVLTELAARHHDRVVGEDGRCLTSASAREEVTRLHTAARGRLQVRVAAAVRSAHSGRRLGLVTWMLFADGWREIVPAPRAGDPVVKVRAVLPSALGATVARMVVAVAP